VNFEKKKELGMVCMQRMQTTYAGHGGDSKGFSTAQPMGKVPHTEEAFRTFLMAHTTKPTVEQSQSALKQCFKQAHARYSSGGAKLTRKNTSCFPRD
jgi:hypothetical protein